MLPQRPQTAGPSGGGGGGLDQTGVFGAEVGGENVAVVCRVRPLSRQELAGGAAAQVRPCRFESAGNLVVAPLPLLTTVRQA